MLKWSEMMPPSESCKYNHVFAETEFGLIVIEHDPGQFSEYYAELPWDDAGSYVTGDSLHEAKTEILAKMYERSLKLKGK